jgi:5'-3' exonuclease
MILIDYNQIFLSGFFAAVGKHTNIEVDEDSMRRVLLNIIRSISKKYKREYGQIVLAVDSHIHWRKEYFPYYKAKRRQARQKSDIDWNRLHEVMSILKNEIKEYFPYKVIEVEGAEADDVIAELCRRHFDQKILIISADKDFKQLHWYANVRQFDPIRKQWIKENNPQEYLFTHILQGDRGDGIPNVLSEDNCLATGIRQKRLTQKQIATFTHSKDLSEHKYHRNYIRNETLINLTKTPDEIKQKISEEYLKDFKPRNNSVMNYFIKHKMSDELQALSEF